MKNNSLKLKIISLAIFAAVILIFGLFGLAESSQAAEYYVATNGNNSNPGTGSQPWLTIQKAANTIIAGDTVYIKAGTYTGRVTPQNSGSAGNYITYQNYGTDTVIIRSPNSDTYDCAVCMKGDITLHYIKFKGLTVENSNYANVDIRASVSYPKSNIILDGLTIRGSYLGVYMQDGVTNSQIINSTLTDNQFNLYLQRANNNILIDNNTVSYAVIKRADYDPSWSHGIVLFNYAGSSNTNVTISNNRVHHNKIQGILIMSSDKILVKDNHCYSNGATGIQIEGMPSTGKSSNIIVENNLCEYNGAVDRWETGIWIDDTDNAIVQNNVVRYNANGMYFTGATNVIVRRNTVYESNQNYGLLLYRSPQFGVCNNIIFAHNTFYKHSGIGAGAALNLGLWSDPLPPTNTRFKNNITSDTLSSLELESSGLTHQLNYNDYYNSTRALSVKWESYTMPWAQYLTTSGQDSNSITTNPLFVNPANADFRLQANSPCANTGDFLTRTSSSGSGTSIPVVDARYFSNGYGIVAGDLIIVGSNSPVRVTNVNYDTNTITLGKSISWDKGDGVSYPYSGSAPDIGAYEYAGAQVADTTPPSAPTGVMVQ